MYYLIDTKSSKKDSRIVGKFETYENAIKELLLIQQEFRKKNLICHIELLNTEEELDDDFEYY